MSVIIVAFDGMDYEMIKEHNLDNIPQEEFGEISLDGVNSVKTTELFTTFITGETYEKHGVKGIKKKIFGNPYLEKVDSLLSRTYIGTKTVILRQALYESINSIDYMEKAHRKEDYELETIFEKVDAGKALFVPGYNPEMEWASGFPMTSLEKGFTRDQVVEKMRELTKRRLEKFWNLNHGFWDLVMLHVHDPDEVHHMFLEDYEEDYRRLDNIAGEIIDEFGEENTVIFMSDHGFPTKFAHNENAFYSCNKELFGEKVPNITDFHDKIIEIADN